MKIVKHGSQPLSATNLQGSSILQKKINLVSQSNGSIIEKKSEARESYIEKITLFGQKILSH